MQMRIGPISVVQFVLITVMTTSAGWATQFVFLDFDSGNDASVNYTSAMRNQIVNGIQTIYSDFDIVIQDTLPAAPFSRVTFNEGSPGGLAQLIDFRNLVPNDTAVVNVTGLGLLTSQYTGASITIGAHELGHLLGLRHGDSFGAIGAGLSSPGPSAGSYLPAFPGPSGGVEVNNNVMGTPAFGVPVSTVSNQHWLSERSATKLAFAEFGTVFNEAPGPKNTLATAQPITLPQFTVPNTIVSGANAGVGDFSVDGMSLIGNLSAGGEKDIYSFQATAGDLFNIEVMSQVIDQRIANPIDAQISVLDSSGSRINYWNGTAFNDDEFETLDSILIDLTIPADGTYFMQVNAYSATDTGGYELFAYRFEGATTGPSGDFDGDGDYACADVDSLVVEIVAGTNNPAFDLTGDGAVDVGDLTHWLAEAGAAELGSGASYLLGDADLDGTVDGNDFVLWNAHKFTAIPAWCSGDFNADGIVDGNDFLSWNANKFTSADVGGDASVKRLLDNQHLIFNAAGATSVPEPQISMLLLIVLYLRGVLSLAQLQIAQAIEP